MKALPSTLDVRHFTNLDELIDEALKHIPLNKIAAKLNITPASCHATVHNARHRVYKQLKGWKMVFQVRRQGGAYLELLALIRAYPYYPQKQEMAERIYHLVGRLQEDLDPSRKALTGVLFALDPLIPSLLGMMDLPQFPTNADEIPAFASSQMIWVDDLNGPKRHFLARMTRSWEFLNLIKAVQFNKSTQRWEKGTPDVWVPSMDDPLHTPLVRMRHHLYLQEFSAKLFDENTLYESTETLALPKALLPALKHLLEQQTKEITELLGDALNAEGLEALRQQDEARYNKAQALWDSLKEQGIEIPQETEESKPCLVRLGSLARTVLD